MKLLFVLKYVFCINIFFEIKIKSIEKIELFIMI